MRKKYTLFIAIIILLFVFIIIFPFDIFQSNVYSCECLGYTRTKQIECYSPPFCFPPDRFCHGIPHACKVTNDHPTATVPGIYAQIYWDHFSLFYLAVFLLVIGYRIYKKQNIKKIIIIAGFSWFLIFVFLKVYFNVILDLY